MLYALEKFSTNSIFDPLGLLIGEFIFAKSCKIFDKKEQTKTTLLNILILENMVLASQHKYIRREGVGLSMMSWN